MREHEAAPLIEGLGFPEGPRWRDGRLWFSDFLSKKVHTLDLSGHFTEVVAVPNVPSGLGWLPDGRLLIVSMEDRKVMRLEGGGELVVHADLSPYARYPCNDMVVDAFGRAYVGNFGFDYAGGEPARATSLMLITADGRVHRAADGLLFPNGAVITPDGRTLIIAETFAARLTAFDIQPGGALANRTVFADFRTRRRGRFPDGICLDEEGAVWVASPSTNECVRILDGGEVTDRVSTGEESALACMLGGPDRKLLFICVGRLNQELAGKILVAQADVPGSGLP
ncbi:MAG TPA: SMP-30/gluconolactonase/LRE family protein [Actinomycetota bacterium]|nr:SMP-30/gluconolactonase/LRE family protein [Actinomycetota bacterium]